MTDQTVQNRVRRTGRRLSRFSRGRLPLRLRFRQDTKEQRTPALSHRKNLVFPPVCIPTWPFTPEVRTGTTHQGLRCMNRRHTTPRQDPVGPPSNDHRVQTFNSVVPIAPRAVPSRFPANQILREQSPWQLSLAFRTESHQHTVW